MVTQRPSSLPTVVEKNTDARWVWAAAAVYAVLLLVFYPAIYTSIDEASAFSMAYVLRHGTIFPAHTLAFHNAEFYPSLSPLGTHGRVYRFPIGFPAVLALLSWAGWRAFFLLNPVVHLVAAGCFAGLLRTARIPVRYAALYLLFPCFVLFTRTLFSDAFAASLTTIGLYFLACRRRPTLAGLCLGLALLSRSASLIVAGLLLLGLLMSDWQQRRTHPLWRGQAAGMLAGLLPFLLTQWAYNFYAFGSAGQSGYSVSALSGQGLLQSGPFYAAALLLIYPGMLLAPLAYRGAFWREGLAGTMLVVLLAASYNESTFGNNILQTLLSTPRQVLPVMPFFLLAFCGVLSGLAARLNGRARGRWEAAAFAVLAAVSGLIAWQHQQYLLGLVATRTEIARTVPAGATVYANKDVYKLWQPVWSRSVCRELPSISAAQCRADLMRGPVYVVLSARTRGFAGEDEGNAGVARAAQAQFMLAPMPVFPATQVQYYRVLGARH